MAFQLVVSPRRRGLLGPVKFTLAAAIDSGIPLFGVIVLRAGWRHAYLDAGRGWWTALALSLFWMLVFLIGARLFVSVVPPLSWLMRDWRKARVEGFKMLVGLGARPKDADAGPRFVGRSSFVRPGPLNPDR